MTDDVLELPKLKAGIFSEVVAFNVRDAFTRAVNVFQLSAQQHNVDIVVNLDQCGDLTLLSDIHRIDQILVNLLGYFVGSNGANSTSPVARHVVAITASVDTREQLLTLQLPGPIMSPSSARRSRRPSWTGTNSVDDVANAGSAIDNTLFERMMNFVTTVSSRRGSTTSVDHQQQHHSPASSPPPMLRFRRDSFDVPNPATAAALSTYLASAPSASPKPAPAPLPAKVKSGNALFTVVVEDSNLELSPLLRAHLTETMRQPNYRTHLQYNDVGLGVLICSYFVAFMGGQIDYSSCLPGNNGTRISFSIPCQRLDGIAESVVHSPTATTANALSKPSSDSSLVVNIGLPTEPASPSQRPFRILGMRLFFFFFFGYALTNVS